MEGTGSDEHENSPSDELSVIVPTCNSASRLGRALRSVKTNLRPSKVVVVDRESEDATRSIAKAYGAEVITDTLSLGSARMKGVRACDSDWVCFVDNDISVPEGYREGSRRHWTTMSGRCRGQWCQYISHIAGCSSSRSSR